MSVRLLASICSLFLLLASCAYGQHIPCDDTLWKHVYNPERLLVHQMCVNVTGIIVDATHGKRKDGVRKEADGDCHGWLKLDPGQEKFLNAGNMSDEEGNLVFEIVCMFPVTQKDAISACKGYKNTVKLPPVGSHARMAGTWVQDDNHAKFNEVHPVSMIQLLDGKPERYSMARGPTRGRRVICFPPGKQTAKNHVGYDGP